MRLRLLSVALGCLALGLPLASQANSALAVDMGCYNCHGTPARADAPQFDRLAARYAKRRGDSTAEQQVLDEFRRAGAVHGIQLHQRVSSDSARQLVHWLFEGAQ